MKTEETLFVVTHLGLEAALAEELLELGFRSKIETGGVTVFAAAGSYRHINVHSRLASRVWLRVADVKDAPSLSSLSLMAYGAEFEIEAVGEAAFRWQHARPSTPGAVRLLLRGHRGGCQVSVDTSGDLLHVRGYRQEVGRAPMRETLASGLLRLARWRPGEPLWDVMCGSGTVVIEAAEQVLGLAPGRARHFAFERFSLGEAPTFKKAGEPLKSEVRGSDINAGALGVTRRNANRAGVLSSLILERLDATQLAARPGPGLVVANLPYGKRVGEKDELGKLYRALGHSLKKACAGWRFALLLEQGAEQLGLRIDERHRIDNGGLHCELVVGSLSA